MASLSNIVTITITKSTRTPTAQGFGTPVIMAYHTHWTELDRIYSSDTGLNDMVTEGFNTWDPAYRMAAALLNQDTTIEFFKIGRLTSAHTHTVKLTITDATAGNHIKFKYISPINGVETQVDYTILGGATTTTVATAVELLTEALADITSTSAVAVVTCVAATAGNVQYFYDLHGCTIEDVTVNTPNYSTILSTLDLADDDWYLVLTDINSDLIVDSVAAWTESRTKLYLASPCDYGMLDGSNTLATDLQALAYDRTGLIWAPNTHEYAAATWAGAVLPFPAGSITWMFKKLKGVTPATLTTAQETELLEDGVNTYETIAGLPITQTGVAVSGEFLDITHGTDQLKARLREAVFGYLASKGKVAYEDEEVGTIVNIVKSTLNGMATKEFPFLTRSTITASGPAVADVSTTDRSNRTLPNIQFAARYASAVHKVKLAGTLSI